MNRVDLELSFQQTNESDEKVNGCKKTQLSQQTKENDAEQNQSPKFIVI